MNVVKSYWLYETLFTFSWWMLLITTIVPIVVWVLIVDKNRIFEIITYGFIVLIIATISDRIGVVMGLWEYKHTLIPLSTVIEVHLVQMPIIYMIIYQYFKTWRTFLIAVTINAFIFAFILESLLIWLEIYVVYHWKHIYSFLPYILIAVLSKCLVNKLKRNHGGS